MARQPLIRTATLGILAAIVFGVPGAASADPAPQASNVLDRRFRLAGSGDLLWIVIGEWTEAEESFSRRFLFREVGADRIQPVTIAQHRQRVAQAAVAGTTLHLFLKDGSHVRLNKSRQWRGHALPDNGVPIALAGESAKGLPRLWAVVTPETAGAIDQASLKRQESQSTASETLDGKARPLISASSTPEPDAQDLRLVVYDGLTWESARKLPAECARSQQVWLTVVQNRIHLFWVEPDDAQTIQYARHEGQDWVTGLPIHSPAPVENAAVLVSNTQLVFAALLKQSNLSALRCAQWSRAAAGALDETWNEAPPLLDAEGRELELGTDAAVGLYGDRLALGRFGPSEPELAFWPAGAGGKAEQPFSAVPAVTAREGPGSPRGLKDLLGTLIVAAVLLILFWRRQESIAAPVALPAELQVAGPGRRAAAFLIDAAPAAAVMLWIWHSPLVTYYGEVRAAAQAGEALREAPAQVLWAWFWFRVMYVVYCTLFECVSASTPGKRLLGCVVLSESVDRAGLLQIGIRNISRMVELEPFLQIWPFMLIVFFTRNRQRLGDLLARTIVVEYRSAPDATEDDVDRREE